MLRGFVSRYSHIQAGSFCVSAGPGYLWTTHPRGRNTIANCPDRSFLCRRAGSSRASAAAMHALCILSIIPILILSSPIHTKHIIYFSLLPHITRGGTISCGKMNRGREAEVRHTRASAFHRRTLTIHRTNGKPAPQNASFAALYLGDYSRRSFPRLSESCGGVRTRVMT